MYPITKAANKDHLVYVENFAKKKIFEKTPICYRVEVIGDPKIDEPKAEFRCEIKEWNLKSNLIGKPYVSVTIHSNLEDVRGYNKATNTTNNDKPQKFSNPRKPTWIKNPKKKVSELTDEEKENRANDSKQQSSSEMQEIGSSIDAIGLINKIGNTDNQRLLELVHGPISNAIGLACQKASTNGDTNDLMELVISVINTNNHQLLDTVWIPISNAIGLACQKASTNGDTNDLMELAISIISSNNQQLLEIVREPIYKAIEFAK